MGLRTGLLMLTVTCWIMPGKSVQGQEAEMKFKQLRDTYLEKYTPLFKAANLAHWQANLSGKDEDFTALKKAEQLVADLQSDPQVFAQLKTLKDSQEIKDPVLARELLMMYNTFLPKQADPELNKRIIELQADVSQIFNTHRGKVQGKDSTENEIRAILSDSPDTALAKEAWTAYMEVGRKAQPKLKELVQLRNQVARKLGYRDFFAMQMELQEFSEAELLKTFDELDALTREPFAALKKQIDESMMKRFHISADQLRPWHTGDLFFQEAPTLGDVNLDQLYADKDILQLSSDYYSSMGLETKNIIARSDFYEKPGKNPHAFCTNIDRGQDIRMLCNIKPNAKWMDTQVHELGHGVYDQYIKPEIPFLLREPSHSLTTEGIAMQLGAYTKNQEFLSQLVKVPADQAEHYAQAVRESLRAEKLIFSRWAQVMLRFEHGMYTNPDQDLNKLWWDLKKKYQLLNPPDDMSGADYGAKMHIVGYPIYYHNYMMGDLFASQVHQYMVKKFTTAADPHETCFVGNKAAGQYLRDEIFAPGNLYRWDELIQRATGEPLSAKYFAQLYVN
ncbi:MAG: hypothetical protein HJJLKODD_00310 [Phycisphaerae bacterium]|nr:hypothetical protein [Phycisphaerae bacterium]